jgi:hypothetical protein
VYNVPHTYDLTQLGVNQLKWGGFACFLALFVSTGVRLMLRFWVMAVENIECKAETDAKQQAA